MGWFVWTPMILGVVAFAWGLWRMITDGRRILYGVALVGGFGLALFCGLVIDPTDAFLFGQINDGNAIALPCAEYIMAGIAEALR